MSNGSEGLQFVNPLGLQSDPELHVASAIGRVHVKLDPELHVEVQLSTW